MAPTLDDETLLALLADLRRGKVFYAQKYLEFRGASVGGRPFSVDDARANALCVAEQGNIPDPEVTRVCIAVRLSQLGIAPLAVSRDE